MHVKSASSLTKTVLLILFAGLVFLSVFISQWQAPEHMRIIGKDIHNITGYLRASVALGDSYLVSQVFHQSLIDQYPVALARYIKEDELLQKLNALESRAPLSRDVLYAKYRLLQLQDNEEAEVHEDHKAQFEEEQVKLFNIIGMSAALGWFTAHECDDQNDTQMHAHAMFQMIQSKLNEGDAYRYLFKIRRH